ncbi:Protein disulfide-isomerase [Coemansia interrupta]|uniref:Protein disulfide-isomerase n=1 Tax=Coemansia interrupta TaxID=1126814 RepID=A0A9W8HT18_9FUNG|nr:Protein disulfide-isomerase [Coemansia interrupta]
MRISRALFTFAAALVLCIGPSAASTSADTRYPDELLASAAASSKKSIPKSSHVIELNKPRYRELLQSHAEIFIEFYATWCAACHGLAPEYNDFAAQASKKYPQVAIARANIDEEYLSSSFMVSMLPELMYLRRGEGGGAHEVRYVSANFTSEELLDYLGGGWAEDKTVGGYKTLWCTPTNICGHIGGLMGELVVTVDRKFNRWDIPPWAFMAIIVSVVYLMGQFAIGSLSDMFRKKYRDSINKPSERETAKPVYFNEYRSDLPKDKTQDGSTPSTPTKQEQQGSATKRSKGKRSKKN